MKEAKTRERRRRENPAPDSRDLDYPPLPYRAYNQLCYLLSSATFATRKAMFKRIAKSIRKQRTACVKRRKTKMTRIRIRIRVK